MKKYFIGVLAALMLFAFTACEPQGIEYPTESSGFGVRTVGDTTYLEGEDFDFRGLEVVQIYKDGSTKPVAAEDLTVSNGENLSSSSKVTINYLGKEVISELEPVVKGINAITVDASTATTQYVSETGSASDSSSFDKTGLVVTGQYKEGETVVLSRVLDADEYTVTFDSQATSAGTEQTATVTFDTDKTATFELTTAEDEVVDYELVKTKEHYYIGDSKALATNFTLKLTWASGNETTGTIADDLVYDDTNVTSNSSQFVAADLTGWSVTTYLKDNEEISKVASITVSDSIASVEAELKDGIQVEKGGAISGSMFDVTVKMKSNPDAEKGTTVTSGIKISTDQTKWVDSISVSHITDAKNITVYVGVEMNGAAVVQCPTQIPVPVAGNQE